MCERVCTICGAAPAPFGYGAHGWRSTMPGHARGRRIWSCAAPACRAACEARKAALDARTDVIWPQRDLS